MSAAPSLEDAVTAWIAHRLAGAVGGVPVEGATASPEETLAALPTAERPVVADIVRRIVVGAPADPAMRAGAREVDPGVFATCTRAFVRSQPVALLYEDAGGRVSERRVQPHGLMVRPPLWYVLGFDLRKDGARRFRLDRMHSAHFMIGPRFEPKQPSELFDDLEGTTFDLFG